MEMEVERLGRSSASKSWGGAELTEMVKPGKEGEMCSSTVLKVDVEVAVSPAMKASCSSHLEEEDADLSQEMGELSLDTTEKFSSGGSCARPSRVCKGKHIVSGFVGDCRENELPLASGTAARSRVKIPAMS